MNNLSIAEIAECLRPHIEALAIQFKGPPNNRMGGQLRWGNKGGFCLSLTGKNAFRWVDYSESDETRRRGDALDLVQRELNCTRAEASTWAANWLGISGSGVTPRPLTAPPKPAQAATDDDSAKDQKKLEAARSIWREAQPIVGTATAQYLKGRGISDDLIASVSGDVLRFHPECLRRDADGEWRRYPAMIALIRNVRTGEGQGIHRTYLLPDGSGKQGNPEEARRVLGALHEGAVMLSPSSDVTSGLHVAEGIETALSVLALGFSPCWSLLSATNLAAFPILPGIDCLTIFADHDEAKGPRLVRAGQSAATSAINRWRQAGLEAIAYMPPREGADFNDLLKGEAA